MLMMTFRKFAVLPLHTGDTKHSTRLNPHEAGVPRCHSGTRPPSVPSTAWPRSTSCCSSTQNPVWRRRLVGGAEPAAAAQRRRLLRLEGQGREHGALRRGPRSPRAGASAMQKLAMQCLLS
jgi:hypothetical protein